IDWDSLANFDFGSNLQYFLDDPQVNLLSQPQSLAQMLGTIDNITAAFCTPDTFTKPAVVYSNCAGPSVRLEYLPRSCVIDDINKQIVCKPAKLNMIKKPGACTYKYLSAAEWTSKECKIRGYIGYDTQVIVGENPYNIPLPNPLA
ncbi:hypothetical protein H632_c2114p0, partial [Helicosporidium sp. ATCC 50920]